MAINPKYEYRILDNCGVEHRFYDGCFEYCPNSNRLQLKVNGSVVAVFNNTSSLTVLEMEPIKANRE